MQLAWAGEATGTLWALRGNAYVREKSLQVSQLERSGDAWDGEVRGRGESTDGGAEGLLEPKQSAPAAVLALAYASLVNASRRKTLL